MPEKDPTTWAAATWLLALGMAFGGGAVYISTVIPKLEKGTTIEIKTAQYQSRALYGGADSGLVISASI